MNDNSNDKKPPAREETLLTDGDEYWTASDVARTIRKTKAWVRNHSNGKRQPTIPSIGTGQSRTYRKNAVLSWMAGLERETASQLAGSRRKKLTVMAS